MLYFFLAGCVFVGLVKWFTPKNDPRTRMERLLAMVPDFSPVLRHDDPWNARTLALDPGSRRFAIGTQGGPVRVFGFDELIAAEVERDGMTVEKTNRGSQLVGAAVGGALLGPAGLLLGGLTGSKRQESATNRLALKLTVNDLQSPVIDIAFRDLTGKVKLSYAQASKRAAPVGSPEERLSEWYGRFRVILHGQGQDGYAPPSPAGSFPSSRRGLIANG